MKRPTTANQNQAFAATVISIPNKFVPALGRLATVGLTYSQASTLGDSSILNRPLLGLCCSTRCPGDVILKTYDLARALRDAEIPVTGGFHSPMEAECLEIFLRGRQPVAVCMARNIPKRIPSKWREPIADGRLVVVSPFPDHCTQPTAQQAAERNRFMAALSQAVFIPHAQPGSKTAEFCEWCQSASIAVFTFPRSEEAELLTCLQAITVPDLIERFKDLDRSSQSRPSIASQPNIKEWLNVVDDVSLQTFIAKLKEFGIHARSPDDGVPTPEELRFFQEAVAKEFKRMKSDDCSPDLVSSLRRCLKTDSRTSPYDSHHSQ